MLLGQKPISSRLGLSTPLIWLDSECCNIGRRRRRDRGMDREMDREKDRENDREKNRAGDHVWGVINSRL